MKVLILTDFDDYGGVASAAVELQKCLRSNEMIVERYPIYIKDKNLFNRFLHFLKAIFYVLFSRADKIILMHFEAILIGLLCKPFRRHNLFVNSVHTDLYGYYENASHFKKVVIRSIFWSIRNDLIVFASREAQLKAKGSLKLANSWFIYNVVALPKTPHNVSSDGVFRFGSVSRLHRGKNIDLLIRVFNSFWADHKETRLLIFGDGPERNRLEEYARLFPCSRAISFEGYVNNPDEIYSKIDALVGFSSMEGFSLVILEALVRNIPVLHSDCSCGPREMLVPASDPCHKTDSYEVGPGGILVKIPEEIVSYALRLQDSEVALVNTFSLFYREFGKLNEMSFVDLSNFDRGTIREKWMDLLLS